MITAHSSTKQTEFNPYIKICTLSKKKLKRATYKTKSARAQFSRSCSWKLQIPVRAQTSGLHRSLSVVEMISDERSADVHRLQTGRQTFSHITAEAQAAELLCSISGKKMRHTQMFKYFWYTVLKQKFCTDEENGRQHRWHEPTVHLLIKPHIIRITTNYHCVLY